MRRGVVLAVVLATALWFGAPARAAELTAGCTDDEGHGHNLSAWAYYSLYGSYHQWYEFRYLLWGEPAGNKSNVNIWLNQTGGAVWQYRSPDSLHSGVTYSTSPSQPVNTYGGYQEWTTFKAIFDEHWSRDARCTADTETL